MAKSPVDSVSLATEAVEAVEGDSGMGMNWTVLIDVEEEEDETATLVALLWLANWSQGVVDYCLAQPEYAAVPAVFVAVMTVVEAEIVAEAVVVVAVIVVRVVVIVFGVGVVAVGVVVDAVVLVVDVKEWRDVQPKARYCWLNWESGYFEFDGNGLGC